MEILNTYKSNMRFL